ncbi:hypothetical protein HYW46_04105 [Candidatus Daviesbacteria bacterium]|nr:hypothetical protein [Candidatus Daviesbacteria bacterium]
MAYVEIYKLNNDGSQKILAVCRQLGEEVVCEGEEKFIEYLNKEGINDYNSPSPKKLFPKDGRLFLEQLKYNFKSGYLNATDLKE